jgi:diguanylate cyclase (GGDEF)-like protein
VSHALAALLLGLALLTPAAPVAAPAASPEALDRLLRLADQQPEEALRQLRQTGESAAPAWLEAWLLVQAGRETQALARVAGERPGVDWLLRAAAARRADRSQDAADAAARSLTALKDCLECDPRLLYEVWRLHAQTHDAQAQQGHQQALRLARQIGDAQRQARSLSALAQAPSVPAERAQSLLQEALALPGLEPVSEGYVQLALSMAALDAGQAERRRAALEAALQRAQGAPRLAALARGNLSDHWLKEGKPQLARQFAEAALQDAKASGSPRLLRQIRHNLVVSLIRLRDLSEARAQARRLESESASWPTRMRLDSLDELSKAWAEAGQWSEALRLLRTERELSTELAERALAQVLDQQRKDQAAARQQSDLALLQAERALQQRQADNQGVLRWIGALAALLLALGLALAGLLWAGSRITLRRLRHSRHRLEGLAEHDALTGLRNRRALQNLMATRERDRSGQGGWLLLDIDHFKRLNDTHGHAAGDQVLQAVAQRLTSQVRDTDLLVRWGGEEFLLHAPEIGAMALRQLAQRLLRAVARDPITLQGGGTVSVSVSIGFLVLPLPEQTQDFDWERAINWADLALYTAKNAGRACAIGILGAALKDERALTQIEADFEGAVHAARVRLVQLRGEELAA